MLYSRAINSRERLSFVILAGEEIEISIDQNGEWIKGATKPDFRVMSRKDLRAYVLKHRDDEAFYAYMNKVKTETKRVKHPPLKSINDIENYPEFLEKIRQGEKYKNS